MEVLSSRVLLRPADFERSAGFYRETLGLHVFRNWDSLTGGPGGTTLEAPAKLGPIDFAHLEIG